MRSHVEWELVEIDYQSGLAALGRRLQFETDAAVRRDRRGDRSLAEQSEAAP